MAAVKIHGATVVTWPDLLTGGRSHSLWTIRRLVNRASWRHEPLSMIFVFDEPVIFYASVLVHVNFQLVRFSKRDCDFQNHSNSAALALYCAVRFSLDEVKAVTLWGIFVIQNSDGSLLMSIYFPMHSCQCLRSPKVRLCDFDLKIHRSTLHTHGFAPRCTSVECSVGS